MTADKEEYGAWAARIKRSHDIIRAQTIDDLHNAGWRIVKLEHYDNFLDDDPDSITCGTHQDAFMVREELEFNG